MKEGGRGRKYSQVPAGVERHRGSGGSTHSTAVCVWRGGDFPVSLHCSRKGSAVATLWEVLSLEMDSGHIPSPGNICCPFSVRTPEGGPAECLFNFSPFGEIPWMVECVNHHSALRGSN
jgi:hypothetical protein